MKAILLFLLVASSPEKFDLICTGTLSHKSLQDEGSETYSRHLRIDLATKKYCEGECKALVELAEVQPTRITLKHEKVDTPRERRFVDETIDRETGRHSGLSTSGIRANILIMKWEGRCEARPFSGFPDFQTKF